MFRETQLLAFGCPTRRSTAAHQPPQSNITRNLSLLAAAGAQLVPFSPLHDGGLPPGVSALLIGGGEPEQWAARLAANGGMLAALRAFAAAGGVVAGEGAAVMYLAATVQTAPQQRHTMGESGFV